MKLISRILFIIYRSLENFKHTVLISAFGITSTCKHQPSCSHYLLFRIEKDGTIRGLWKGFKRLITCW